MRAENIMTREVICVTTTITAHDTYKVMLKHGIRHMPVVMAQHLQGIVSDRDLLRIGTVEENGSLTVPEQPIGEIMSLVPITASPSASVSHLAGLMLKYNIDAVPIVHGEDRLVGLVTSSDLLGLLIEDERLQEPMPFDFNLQVLAQAG
jgi:acetoin utilization protein AcuB